MFCLYDGLHHCCEDTTCLECSVRAEYVKTHRRIRTVLWRDPEEELPEDPDSYVLAIVNGRIGENAYLEEAYELLTYADGEWMTDLYPEIKDLEVLWWMDLPATPNNIMEV